MVTFVIRINTATSCTQAWSLSSPGNWDSVTTGSSTETRTHDINNRITDRSASGSPVDPTYDSAGNLTKNGNSSNLTYDAWGKIVEATTPSGITAGTWTWEYDGLGRRIQTYFLSSSSLVSGGESSSSSTETSGEELAEGELPWNGIPGSVFSTELIGESSSLTEEDPPPGLLSGGSVTDLYYTVHCSCEAAVTTSKKPWRGWAGRPV